MNTTAYAATSVGIIEPIIALLRSLDPSHEEHPMSELTRRRIARGDIEKNGSGISGLPRAVVAR